MIIGRSNGHAFLSEAGSEFRYLSLTRAFADAKHAARKRARNSPSRSDTES